MSKLAIVGDMHFGVSNTSVPHHEYMRKFLRDFFKYIDDNDIHTVLQLGDLFDVRKHINTWSLNFFRKEFLEKVLERNLHVYVLIGNHDIFYRESIEISSVEEILTHHPEQFTIIKNVSDMDIGGYEFLIVPWVCKENIDEVSKAIAKSKSKYCAGHFEFNGFELYRGHAAKTHYTHDSYSKFKQVFSGHFHHMSSKDNVLYVGTPYELTWVDSGCTKGFFVLENEHLEFVENKHTLYSYIRLSDHPIISKDDVEDKFVKLNIDVPLEPIERESIIDRIHSMKPHKLSIIEAKIEEHKTVDVEYDRETTVGDLIGEYVGAIEVPDKLDRDLLKTVMMEIYSEAIHASQDTLD